MGGGEKGEGKGRGRRGENKNSHQLESAFIVSERVPFFARLGLPTVSCLAG